LLVGKGGMNPFLSAANWSNIAGKEWKVCKDTTTARQADKAGLGCSDAPGFGSGITWYPCGEKVYTSTDRGPNQDCGDLAKGRDPDPAVLSGKGFPLRMFAPTVTEIELTAAKLNIKAMLPLQYNASRSGYGKYATGLSTKGGFMNFDDKVKSLGGDDKAATGDCAASISGVDGGGLDTEDVQPLANGFHIACDEYGKVIVFDSTGKINVTYVSVGQDEFYNTSNTGSPVKAILPPSFSFRRANRGLESIAVSGDKTRAYTCQQSTMDGDDKAGAINTARNSRVIRCAVLDISDPLNAQLVSEKYFFASPASKHPYKTKVTNATSGTSTWTSQAQADIKISAAYWLRDNKVALLERTDGMVRFHEVDFDTGDNLQQSSYDTTRGLELKLKETKFAQTSNFFAGLANLEAATTCSDSSCKNACCPPGTCDTAPVCTSSSTSPERGFTGMRE